MKGSRYAPNRRRFRRPIPLGPRPASRHPWWQRLHRVEQSQAAMSVADDPGRGGPDETAPTTLLPTRLRARPPAPQPAAAHRGEGTGNMGTSCPHPGEGARVNEAGAQRKQGGRWAGKSCGHEAAGATSAPPAFACPSGHGRGRTQRDSPVGGRPAAGG